MSKLKNDGAPLSAVQTGQDAPRNLISSDKGKKVSQENTDEELSLVCKRDPDHPGEYRCRPTLVSKTTSPPAPVVSTDHEGKIPESHSHVEGNVETWTRADGSTVRVRRIQRFGSEIYVPVKETSSAAVKNRVALATVKPECKTGLCTEDSDVQVAGKQGST
jgi:hypothetical protein